MGGEWRTVAWGDVLTLEYGKSLRGYREVNGKYRVFGSNGPIGWADDYIAKGPGVILGRKGAYRGVEYCSEPFHVIDTAYYVKPKVELNFRWLYYAMKYYRIGDIDDGSPIPSTTRSAVYVSELRLPSLSEQESIAHILGNLDDKIELNRQTNQTLEAMAQALFKSWFVDFDPVIDNALAAGNDIPEPFKARAAKRQALGNERKPLPEEIRREFPDEFEFVDEMGWVPRGWLVEPLHNHINVLNGYAFKSADYSDEGIFVLRTKNFNSNNLIDRLADDVFLPETFRSSHAKYLCEPFDYHLVMVGASVGERGLLLPHQLPALRNQNMWCLRPSNTTSIGKWYTKLLIDSLISKKIGLASGSAREFFRKGDFRDHLLHVAPVKLLSEFERTCMDVFRALSNSEREVTCLVQMRDTLLPKLLSGQLTIPDAEKLTADAL